MVDLGTLPGGSSSQAQAVNRTGQVAGFASVAPGLNHAFLADGGAMTDLGTLPGAGASAARGINSQGHVVGDSGSALQTRAFLYADGVMAALDSPGGSGASSVGMAINDADQVAGAAWDTAEGLPVTAVRWDAGTPRLLGLPAAAGATSSYGRAINAGGIVVGTFARPQSPLPQGAFISDGTRMANLEDLLDAASAGWQVYAAMGIADDNTVSVLVWDGAAFRFALLQPD
jgi:probable HAF family extracellular repeat protein